MSKERRLSPRKECAVPLRFRVLTNGNGVSKSDGVQETVPRISSFLGVRDGQAVNLSERGMYFRARQEINVGDPLEMYFTLPRELTGRESEQVRCSARVVHVDAPSDSGGPIGVGVAVERFETLTVSRNWSN
jgi:hypothetical protein